eukprot:11221447-Lingulodinium_polyedra.AAC.1
MAQLLYAPLCLAPAHCLPNGDLAWPTALRLPAHPRALQLLHALGSAWVRTRLRCMPAWGPRPGEGPARA